MPPRNVPGGVGASDPDAQRTFLEMMGLLESADIICIGPTVSLEEADILCSALSHDYCEAWEGEDKYFTPEEYRRVSSWMCSQVSQRIEDNAPM